MLLPTKNIGLNPLIITRTAFLEDSPIVLQKTTKIANYVIYFTKTIKNM